MIHDLPRGIAEECATHGCENDAEFVLESGGAGSYYCPVCASNIQAAIDEERHQVEIRELESRAMEEHFERHPHG